MGKAHRRHAAAKSQLLQEEKVREQERLARVGEETRSYMEQYFGTEVAAQAGAQDPRLLSYLYRFESDPAMFEAIKGYGIRHNYDPWSSTYDVFRYQDLARSGENWGAMGVNLDVEAGGQGSLTTEAYTRLQTQRLNYYLDQARAAAKAGDYTRAEGLKAQALSIQGSFGTFGSEGFNLVPAADEIALYNLRGEGSPTGQIVQELFSLSEDLLDPLSKGFQTALREQVEPAKRSFEQQTRANINELVAQARELEPTLERQALRKGAARAMGAEASRRQAFREGVEGLITQEREALAERTSEFEKTAALFMQQFGQELAGQVQSLRDEYITGAAFVRPEYEQQVAALNLGLDEARGSLLQTESKIGDQFREYAQQQSQRERQQALARQQALLQGAGGLFAAGTLR